MGKQTVHVTPHGADWQVKKSGNERASAVTDTQQCAIDVGRQMAKEMRTELVIHGRDGQIRDKDSYGNDPCPPVDKKH
jgi:hypothetical protein